MPISRVHAHNNTALFIFLVLALAAATSLLSSFSCPTVNFVVGDELANLSGLSTWNDRCAGIRSALYHLDIAPRYTGPRDEEEVEEVRDRGERDIKRDEFLGILGSRDVQ